MLGMKSYPGEYLEDLPLPAGGRSAGLPAAGREGAVRRFAARFFNNQVLVLNYMFVHRLAWLEGKDGEPRYGA